MSKLEVAGYIEIKKEFVDKIPRTLLRLTDKGREVPLVSVKVTLQVLHW